MTNAPLKLRTDGAEAPMSVGATPPEFSWRLPDGAGAQRAWEIETRLASSGALVWTSGRNAGARPFGIRYAGAPLSSSTAYTWRVRVWIDDAPDPTSWSDARFETGILSDDDWVARWVAGPARGPKDPPAPVVFRSSAVLPEGIVEARAYVSSLGWHRLALNGLDLTGPALVPRWTDFDQEVEYIVYDASEAVVAGENEIRIVVGDGRFRGRNGFENHARVYGDRLAVLMKLVVRDRDGGEHIIVTDGDWQVSPARITESDPKTGERVDLRLPGDLASSRLQAAAPVVLLEHPRRLVPETVERVTQVDELPPVSITRLPGGRQIVDFGQNFAGVVRLRLNDAPGTVVTLTHSEIRKDDGDLDVDYIHLSPVGRWYQRDVVIVGEDEMEWQPWFTVHGFRYVRIEGLARDLGIDDVRGVVLSSALDRTGAFDCSDPRLVRLRSNVEWSMRSNFSDTSTDCPTRERSGWTGDIQVFAPTATGIADVQWYLRRFLHNLAAEQNDDGTVPVVIPSGFADFSGGPRGHLVAAGTAAGWGDASVLVPWTLYRYYGDERVLRDQFDSMVAWVEACARLAAEGTSRARRRAARRDPDTESHIVDTGFQFGEWLRPGEGPIRSSIDARRRGAVVATAYLEHSARTLAGIAEVLGRAREHERFLALADRVRAAWRSAFVDTGRIGTDRQDDYVRALAFDLLEPDERPGATRRLVELIDEAGGLGTGFLSTPLLLGVLVDNGRADVAWRLLSSTTNPSWLAQVERGATTVWETWEGYTRSGKAKMSHNHYALGTVGQFLTERIAGVRPQEPGFAVVSVEPLVGGGLTHARARVGTPFGEVSSAWRVRDGHVEHEVSVPPGATARFRGGDGEVRVLSAGKHTFRIPKA